MYYIEIDFNSDEALYLQLCHQIIQGIASTQLREGDSLPSVRQLADRIGVNMHTVNKAYTVLRQEGYVKVDRRKGTVVCVDTDRERALEELRKDLLVVLAKSSSRGITKSQVMGMIEEIYDEYGSNDYSE
ncbi:MAG: GntR family transcriptional regulator [Lachnospiraceae bacterium]|nr:GntR family transcriptional regulator [Lachnospiraceae bacterium]